MLFSSFLDVWLCEALCSDLFCGFSSVPSWQTSFFTGAHTKIKQNCVCVFVRVFLYVCVCAHERDREIEWDNYWELEMKGFGFDAVLKYSSLLLGEWRCCFHISPLWRVHFPWLQKPFPQRRCLTRSIHLSGEKATNNMLLTFSIYA